MDEERLTRIEERLAHQEHAAGELSDVLHRQQAEIERLTMLIRQLAERLEALREAAPGNPLDEKPPHY